MQKHRLRGKPTMTMDTNAKHYGTFDVRRHPVPTPSSCPPQPQPRHPELDSGPITNGALH
ncbi:hypothetical protein [Pseudoalteromonas luteoviolacea]|uniref:Uncharacterized protein n=1 Tax=Pseudoalteromonas luteoviolacea (strain 2ta16) TaxID=1353533 RepID=V4HXN6_PSEL2|nr:hypothetical protein [Pseudoalteromonas luteoviolacea]ESP94553.1 hypothetical protein PL2TA16_00553 [Pseudoalteromonas luteoviolacea 2ta16]